MKNLVKAQLKKFSSKLIASGEENFASKIALRLGGKGLVEGTWLPY